MYRCKYCGGEARSIGTDISSAGGSDRLRRRRECVKCGRRFLTVEVFERDIKSPKTYRAELMERSVADGKTSEVLSLRGEGRQSRDGD